MRFNNLFEDVDFYVYQLNSLPSVAGVSNTTYSLIKDYEGLLKDIPVGTKLEHQTDAGLEIFKKVEDGWWEHEVAPHHTIHKKSEFDIARWLAGRRSISRSFITVLDEAMESDWKILHDTYKNEKVYENDGSKSGMIMDLIDWLQTHNKDWTTYDHKTENKISIFWN